MSILTLDRLPDADLDIESELDHSDRAHSFVTCETHRHQRPVTGSIIKVLCGRLIRWKDKAEDTPLCDECQFAIDLFTVGNCTFCGKKVHA